MQLYKEHKAENGKLAWMEYVGKWFVLAKDGKYLHSYSDDYKPRPTWTSARKFACKLQEDGAFRYVADLSATEAQKMFGGLLEEVA